MIQPGDRIAITDATENASVTWPEVKEWCELNGSNFVSPFDSFGRNRPTEGLTTKFVKKPAITDASSASRPVSRRFPSPDKIPPAMSPKERTIGGACPNRVVARENSFVKWDRLR